MLVVQDGLMDAIYAMFKTTSLLIIVHTPVYLVVGKPNLTVLLSIFQKTVLLGLMDATNVLLLMV